MFFLEIVKKICSFSFRAYSVIIVFIISISLFVSVCGFVSELSLIELLDYAGKLSLKFERGLGWTFKQVTMD